MLGNWNYPTSILIGNGKLSELKKLCDERQLKRIFFVTDKNILDLPIIQQLLSNFCVYKNSENIFSDVNPNPSEIDLKKGLEKFNAGNFDCIVSIGGGSVIDIGKLIAFMSTQLENVWFFEDGTNNWKKANTSFVPNIAIPTTSGTGSEVGRASVIVNKSTLQKKIIFHPKIMPELVISDPQIASNMPCQVTASTGIDAFVHCFEAYCSEIFHPLSQGIAVEGMKICKNYLPIAFENPNNIEARLFMMAASIMGATSFQKGLGAIHAMSHPIGAIYDCPHGLINSILLPHIIKLNKTSIEKKILDLCDYLKIDNGFNGFCDFIDEIKTKLKLPKKFKDINVDLKDIDFIIKSSFNDLSMITNPVKLKEKDLFQIIEKCI